jgi:carbon dioxide concentrating mechanism protein CcmL
MKKNQEYRYESSKFQVPNSNEASSSKFQKGFGGVLDAWNLEFLWNLELGTWSFFVMRLGTVIGRVTLSKAVPALTGARWLIVSPFTREHFQQGTETPPGMSKDPSVVVYDSLGGGVGQTIGFTEGREAAQPFEQPTPIDAINAALVDEIFYSPFKK